LADALSAHDEALEFGGLAGVIDLSLVQSALGRPYSGYHRSIQQKAAVLLESMARNHGFADGNKRTTLLLLHMLIVRSGYRLAPLAGENINQAIEELILDVVNRRIILGDAIDWFRARIRR
jgi:death-on-curing protein